MRQDQGLRSYYRVASPPRINEKLDMQDINLYDLVDILLEIYFQHEDTTPLSDVVTITTLTLKKRISEIIKIFRRYQKKSFSDLLPENFSRLDLVVTFLAILELVKNHSLSATQNSLFSDIEFEKTELIGEEFEPEL
jgi:segregation and condensation protein A